MEEDCCWKITGNMTIAKVIQRYPHLQHVLAQMGLACCSCFGAQSDTIDHVAHVYGLDPEIVVHTLNVATLFPESK
jgi:hybrid cluster-associated redox disulfide protein